MVSRQTHYLEIGSSILPPATREVGFFSIHVAPALLRGHFWPCRRIGLSRHSFTVEIASSSLVGATNILNVKEI